MALIVIYFADMEFFIINLDLFTVPPQSNNAIVMKYITCENVFVNQAANLLQYCSGSWVHSAFRIACYQ